MDLSQKIGPFQLRVWLLLVGAGVVVGLLWSRMQPRSSAGETVTEITYAPGLDERGAADDRAVFVAQQREMQETFAAQLREQAEAARERERALAEQIAEQNRLIADARQSGAADAARIAREAEARRRELQQELQRANERSRREQEQLMRRIEELMRQQRQPPSVAPPPSQRPPQPRPEPGRPAPPRPPAQPAQPAQPNPNDAVPGFPNGYTLDCNRPWHYTDTLDQYLNQVLTGVGDEMKRRNAIGWALTNYGGGVYAGGGIWSQAQDPYWQVQINRRRVDRGLHPLTVRQFRALVEHMRSIIPHPDAPSFWQHPAYHDYSYARQLFDRWNRPFQCDRRPVHRIG